MCNAASASDMSKKDAASASGEQLKERGNAAFKAGDYDEALRIYAEAIDVASKSDAGKSLLATLHKNCAAVHLKQDAHQQAADECDKALELVPDDPKTLFRRCQAYEAMDKIELAYADARHVHRLDPTNKAIQPVLERLHQSVSRLVQEMSQVSNKVESMTKIVFNSMSTSTSDLTGGGSIDDRRSAADNLVVLARERAGAEALIRVGIVPKITSLMKVERDAALRLSIVRCIGELCKRSIENAKSVLATCGIPFFLDILNVEAEEAVNAASYVIQTILNTLSDKATADKCRALRRRPKETSTEEKKWVVAAERRRMTAIKTSVELQSICRVIVHNLSSRTLRGIARDALLELIMQNCKYDQLFWADALLNVESGYERLMEVASETSGLPFKHESSMETTEMTRSLVGICIGCCYDALYDDKSRALCSEQISQFVADRLRNPTLETQMHVVAAITTLLRHAPDLGQSQLGKDGILAMMVDMARSESVSVQIAAAEALIAAAAKKKDTSFILTHGLDVLKTLFKSESDEVKVRALVGMCKIGASSGHDASMRPFADGSSLKLGLACRKFLTKEVGGSGEQISSSRSLRRWAVEGLSYLTLDAEVKEQLCEDAPAIEALMTLASDADATKQEDVQYAIVTLFVNVLNAYEKQEIMPEMVELAKFAKHHIPEEHELDDADFVDKRIYTLTHCGLATALTSLTKLTKSKNVRELIARLFNAMCRHVELRGIVVQQGGCRALCSLAVVEECEADISGSGDAATEKGRRQAAQALARIGITQDPAIAFPGQRSVDVVRPLCYLLNAEFDGLENFEALMALGNLATLNEVTRARILNTVDFASQIDGAMFEEHAMIRRAAVQCFANLCASPLQIKRCEGRNDKVKYLVLLCGETEDDIELVTAATAALAMLTSQSAKCCTKIFEASQWTECLLSVVANENMNIVLRATVVVKNMIESDRQTAERVVATQLIDCLQAHIFKAQLDEGSHTPDAVLQSVARVAREALNAAHGMNLLKSRQQAEAEQAAKDEACETDDET